MTADVLIVGAGPAGLALAAALDARGVRVEGVAPAGPDAPWTNTYGVWEDELPTPTLTTMLRHRWTDCVAYADDDAIRLDRVYGLIDNLRLQEHLLTHSRVRWRRQAARAIRHTATHSMVTLTDGSETAARVVVDASGHAPIFVQRPVHGAIAYQAAYGVVGRFAQPPVRPGRLVLMDFRADYLTVDERKHAPPTFLYAMDLGEGRFFVEETSLAHAPAAPFDMLRGRLHRRLAHWGCPVIAVEHEEFCLFPMNMPVPLRNQPVLGYGGAASMVHPASGYQVGAALRYAPFVAQALADALQAPGATPSRVARAGWDAIWPPARLQNHRLYLFGLQTLLSFDTAQLQRFFAVFFRLPREWWGGYLSNTLTTPQVMQTMLALFLRAPGDVRRSLMTAALRRPTMLLAGVFPEAPRLPGRWW
ncbi:MAG TPA: lycopene cyclase family protein [Chloroflexi bacterium]|nr:lycopene cyclase family protein [Chloroflexota bacterium]